MSEAVGDSAVYLLAIASCSLFGVVGVLTGLAVGVRAVTRDEGRWKLALNRLEALESDQSRLRLDWGTTLESLEGLADAVEKKRRQAAASASAVRQNETEQAPRPMTPAEQRLAIRRKLRSA